MFSGKKERERERERERQTETETETETERKRKLLQAKENLSQDFCDPMDCSLPGSSVHGIFQARILEWIAISYPGYLLN